MKTKKSRKYTREPNKTIEQDTISDRALLVPADEQIANDEVAYGRDHDDRFDKYKRGPSEHRCKGPQCEETEGIPQKQKS